MHADDFFRTFRHGAKLGQGDRRGVAGKNRIWSRNLIKLLKDLLFDLVVFGGGFNNEINVAHVVKIRGAV